MTSHTLHRVTRTAALLAATLAPVTPVLAQNNQPLPRPPGGMRFLGTSGFIDYDRGVAPSNAPLLPLVLWSGDQMEPPAALLPGELQGRPIEFNWPLLDAIDLGAVAHCAFPLIGGETRELVFVRKETFTNRQYNWYGQIAGIPASDFILSRYEDAIVLQVSDYDRKERFTVRYAPPIGTLPARSTLVHNSDDVEPNWCATGSAGAAPPPANGDGGEPGGNGGGGVGIMSAADPTNVVDMLFITTNELVDFFSSNQAQINAHAQFLVSAFNTTSNNSNAGVTMRIAAVLRGNYNENASGGTDLSNLAAASNGLQATFSMRSMVRADHVCLLRRNTWPSDSGGTTYGVAYRPPTLNDAGDDLYGFSVVAAVSGNFGSTFSHEIGHNFGACHDAATNAAAGTCTSAITTSPHGKRWSCNRGVCTDHWHTTMAYGNNPPDRCSDSTRVPFFSNPALTYVTPIGCSNFILGDSISNVANLIQTSRSLVSQRQIGSTRQWTLSVYGGVGNGTYHAPFLRILSAVGAVQGGTAEGEVLLTSGNYNETGHNGGSPVLLRNPCVLKLENGAYGTTGPALVR